jgi:hypothetical protein
MANLKASSNIRKHRGPVMVGMLVRDNVVYVRAYKSDLLYWLTKLPEGSVRTSKSAIDDGTLYVDAGSD